VIVRHVLCILICICTLSSCQIWEKTKSMYRGSILPAKVNVDARPDVGENVQRLVHVVAPIDMQIERLVESLERMNALSRQELESMFSRFPWLNGVGAYTPSGEVEYQIPAQPVKRLSRQDILEVLAEEEDIYVRYLDLDLGPELCVVKPELSGEDIGTYIVAHFDPRSLFTKTTAPESLLVLYQGKILWSGTSSAFNASIEAKDWRQIQAQGVQGDFQIQDRKFVWLSRYIGKSPLVYVVYKENAG